MDDRMKAVRESLEGAKEFVTEYMVCPMNPEWEVRHRIPLLEKLESSIAALDALAVEPGEDALELSRQIYDTIVGDSATPEWPKARILRLLTSRDERIKAEERKACADRAIGYFFNIWAFGAEYDDSDLRAAIMRTEVEG